MKLKKSLVKLSAYIPQSLLLLSILTTNVFFPAIAIAEEIENLSDSNVVIIDESEDILEEGISTDIFEPYFTYENGEYYISNVEEREYVYPDDANFRITFKSITQDGDLSIKRILLSQEDRDDLNTTDFYAWEIKSSMDNGSFIYDLILPNLNGIDANVKYSQDGIDYSLLENVIVNEYSVTIKDLDHFTVFVVTTDNPPLSNISDPTCVEAGGTSNSHCFNSIQDAINASTDGDTILIKNGSYTITSTIVVNKEVTITGESKEEVLINMSSLSGYGWDISRDNVTIENMTVTGTGQTTNTARTFKFGNPEPKINNGVLNNIHVNGGYKTPFDIHGVNNFLGTNLTATNTPSGVGLSLSGVNGAIISGFSGTNNSWGDIAIFVSTFTSPQRGSSNITINDNNNIGVIYAQDYPGTLQNDIDSIDISNRTYVMQDAGSSMYYMYLKNPSIPTQTGYNINDGSEFSTPRDPNQLNCVGSYTNVNGASIHWTDVSEDENVKYQRQYKVNSGGWTGSEIYSNPYTNYRSFGGGTGNEGIYGSRVRSFIDLNGNNIFDVGEPVSDWSNECYITFDKTAPQVPTGLYFHDVINNKDVQCGEYTNTTNLNVHWDEIQNDQSFSHFEYSSFNAPSGAPGIVSRRFDTNFFNSSWWNIPTEGTYGVQVRSVDKAGNKSEWFGREVGIDNSCQFKVDWTAPTTPTNLRFENPDLQCGDITNSFNITAVWDESEDLVSGVKEYIYHVDTPNVKGWTTTRPTNSYNGVFNQGDGEYTFKVKAIDNVGIESDWSDTCTVIYDSTNPTVQITSHIDEEVVNSQIEIKGDIFDLNLLRYWFVVHNTSGQKVAGPNTVNHDGPEVQPSFFFDTTTVPDGVYTIKLEARDKADNKGPESVHWVKIIVDNSAPTTTFDVNYSNGIFNQNIQILGTSVDTNSVAVVYVQYKLSSDTEWTDLFELHNNDLTPSYSWDSWWGPSVDGIYDIKAYAVDGVGNVESSAIMTNITFDRTQPEIRGVNIIMDYLSTYVNGTTGFMIISNVQDTLSGIDSNSCMYTLDGSIWAPGTYSRGRCMFGVSSSQLFDSQKISIQTKVDDRAGNSTTSRALERTVDSDYPTSQANILDNYYGPNSRPEIRGTADDTVSEVTNVMITIQRSTDNRYWMMGNVWSRIPMMHNVTGTNSWTYTSRLPMMRNGIEYRVTPYAWDQVHMMPGIGTADAFVWDSELPNDPERFRASHELNVPSQNTQISVSFEPGYDALSGVAGHYYSFSNTQETPDLTNYIQHNNLFSYSATSENLSDGIWWFNIRTIDNVGNITSTAHYGPFIVDTTPPTQVEGISIFRGHNSDIENDLGCEGYTNTPQVRINWDSSTDENGIDYYWFGTKFNAYHRKVQDPKTYYDANMTPGNNPYYYTVIAVDMAGNESVISDSCGLILDQTKPILSQIGDFFMIEGDTLPQVEVDITEDIGLESICLNLPDYSYEMCDDSISSDITQYDMMDFVINNLLVTTVDTSILPIGVHNVEYYAYDLAGNQSDVMTLQVEILDNVPTVSIQGVTTATEGDPIITLNSLITEGNAPFTYVWGGSCSGTNPTSEFNPITAGSFTCTLLVTDVDGDTDTDTHTIVVNPLPQPEVLGTQTTRKAYASTSYILGTGDGDPEITEEEILGEEDDANEILERINSCEETKKLLGYLYIDANKNGEFDEEEEILSDVRLKIYITSNGNQITITEVTTDSSGYWEAMLCPGEYNIEVISEDLPSGVEIGGVLSITVNEDQDSTEFNIPALQPKTFLQKYWYVVVIGVILGIIAIYAILKRRYQE